MAQKLTEADKVRLLTKLEDGSTIREVAAQMGLNKTTVLKIKKRWENEGSISRKRGTGLHRISTEEQDHNLVQHLRANPFDSAKKAVAETNFPGSRRTASRRIRESEIRYRVAAKKFQLSEEGKQARLLFALNHIYNEPRFWENVVFSDEKTFQSASNGTVHVYRPAGRRYDELYINNSDRQGRFSISIWGWISYHDAGMCYRINGRLNSQVYIHILENVMLPSVQHVFPENDFIYQQDNCPVHTANAVSQWFQEHNIEVLQWVAKSADINPIENVWAEMAKSMARVRFRNREELWEAIENSWEALLHKPNYFKKLVLSVPRRLRAVIDANGGPTKY